MIVSRLFEPALAQASYLIGCADSGEAIVVDPNRDIARYLDEAERLGLRIAHVTETHVHADFLSGARELAATTGARLFLSGEGDRTSSYRFLDEATSLVDGEHIAVGRVRLDVVATPGHTPEHIMFLVTDTAVADVPMAAVTGDFLFVGDVGRPDLLEKAVGIEGSMAASARALFASLAALSRYEDWLQVWPGHGAGSACGKGISAVPSSTLGYERRFNWALQATSEAGFVDRVLSGQPAAPTYFAAMKRLNASGPPPRASIAPPRIDPTTVATLLAAGAWIIDLRPSAAVADAHIPGTLHIPLGPSLPPWAGWLVPENAELYLMLDAIDASTVLEAQRLLGLIGLDRIVGVIDAAAALSALGPDRHRLTTQATPATMAHRVAAGEVQVLDVREAGEWNTGHLDQARHIPLGRLSAEIARVPDDRPLLVHCQAGLRSAIAVSVLERAGRDHVIDLAGGLSAWRASGLPVTPVSAGTGVDH